MFDLWLAVTIPDAWIAGAGVFLTGTIIPGAVAIVRFLRSKWEKREEEYSSKWEKREEGYKLETKARTDRYKVILDQKDAKIEELSKLLSKKSDDHAGKIEELLKLTVDKIESLNDRDTNRHEKHMQILQDLTQELRRVITGESGRYPPA